MGVPAYLNKTEKITVTFYGWPSDSGTAVPENPSSVSVKIFNTDTIPDTLLTTASPTASGPTGKYYYNWTPTTEGNFNIQFYATFSDGSVDVVNNFFTAYEAVISPAGGSSLISDQVIQLAGILNPFYLDPSEVHVIYPDANIIEVAELIWRLSVEVMEIEKLDNTKTPPDAPSYLGLEYIQAAAACALSRIYDDVSGGNEFSFSLGDLSIQNRAYPKQVVSRGNATTWCELAAALRKELVASKVGMRATSKGRGGGDRVGIIPTRRLRAYEKGTSYVITDYDPYLPNPSINNF